MNKVELALSLFLCILDTCTDLFVTYELVLRGERPYIFISCLIIAVTAIICLCSLPCQLSCPCPCSLRSLHLHLHAQINDVCTSRTVMQGLPQFAMQFVYLEVRTTADPFMSRLVAVSLFINAVNLAQSVWHAISLSAHSLTASIQSMTVLSLVLDLSACLLSMSFRQESIYVHFFLFSTTPLPIFISLVAFLYFQAKSAQSLWEIFYDDFGGNGNGNGIWNYVRWLARSLLFVLNLALVFLLITCLTFMATIFQIIFFQVVAFGWIVIACGYLNHNRFVFSGNRRRRKRAAMKKWRESLDFVANFKYEETLASLNFISRGTFTLYRMIVFNFQLVQMTRASPRHSRHARPFLSKESSRSLSLSLSPPSMPANPYSPLLKKTMRAHPLQSQSACLDSKLKRAIQKWEKRLMNLPNKYAMEVEWADLRRVCGRRGSDDRFSVWAIYLQLFRSLRRRLGRGRGRGRGRDRDTCGYAMAMALYILFALIPVYLVGRLFTIAFPIYIGVGALLVGRGDLQLQMDWFHFIFGCAYMACLFCQVPLIFKAMKMEFLLWHVLPGKAVVPLNLLAVPLDLLVGHYKSLCHLIWTKKHLSEDTCLDPTVAAEVMSFLHPPFSFK